MLNHTSFQMELNFEGTKQNRFRDHLNSGTFQFLAEIRSPSADTKLENAVARFSDFQYLTEISGTKGMPAAGLALIHEADDADTLDPVQFLSTLCKDNPDAHLLYLSGRGRTADDIYAAAGHALSGGIKNFCAVSGMTPPGATADDVRRIPFLESVNILKKMQKEKSEDLFIGATANPFKYTSSDSMLQYFKAVKKASCGASFFVTQSGWDMKKLQEFRWQMWRRSINVPLIARLTYLNADRMVDLCSGKITGNALSPDLEHKFRQELQMPFHKFQTIQIRRFQLHAAGASLMGYSGIQVAGIDSAETFQILLRCVGEALREFQNFEDWLAAYQQFYARMELAPYPYRFYLFEDLLTQAQPPDEFKLCNSAVQDCTQTELLRHKLAQILFSNAGDVPATERKITKKLLLSCRSCDKCRVAQTMYICPEICPKGMANGPCGCSRTDGSCEFSGDRECEFQKRGRLANAFMDFSMLENECVDNLDKRPE